jgi:uncharacterized protein (DUF1684 family)
MVNDGSDWREAVRSHRSEKAATFASREATPLGDAAFEDFDGFEFYTVEESVRVTGRLETVADPETVSLKASRGPPMSFERVGQLGVTVDGEFAVLETFRAPGVEALLVPFRDRTNGTETWSEGRYLTIPGPADAESAQVLEPTVDFNLAYHPLCVYDPSVRSALPPAENELPLQIRAGERLPGSGE